MAVTRNHYLGANVNEVLVKAPCIDIDVTADSGILWLHLQGIVTTDACADVISVLRAELSFTPARCIIIDARRTIIAISMLEWGEIVGEALSDPVRQPLGYIVPRSLPAGVQSGHAFVMGQRGLERAFFQTTDEAYSWASLVTSAPEHS
jgi:hypothetical protein